MEQNCYACRYWHNLPDLGSGGAGQCRRHAPAALTGAGDRAWPITGEAEGCGDFEAASVELATRSPSPPGETHD